MYPFPKTVRTPSDFIPAKADSSFLCPNTGKKENLKLNLLDCTPVREPDLKWTEDENGIITLHRTHTTFTDRLAHKITKKPLRQSHITLEEFGSFLWKIMDGRTTLRDLADQLKEEFGESIEPLYPRLEKYMVVLKNNKLIFWELPERPEVQERKNQK